MNKLSRILLALIIVIIPINIYYFSQFKRYNDITIELSKELVIYKDLLNKLYDNLIIQLKCEYMYVNKEWNLQDENGNYYNIEEIINKNKQLLVFRFSKENCQTCVSDQINCLKKALPEHEFKKVIFLLKTTDKNELQKFKLINNIKSHVYSLENDISPIDELNNPYFFCISKDGIINKVFIPHELSANIIHVYFKEILNIIK